MDLHIGDKIYWCKEIDSSLNVFMHDFCCVRFSRNIFLHLNHITSLRMNKEGTKNMLIFLDVMILSNRVKTGCNFSVGGGYEIGKVLNRPAHLEFFFVL